MEWLIFIVIGYLAVTWGRETEQEKNNREFWNAYRRFNRGR